MTLLTTVVCITPITSSQSLGGRTKNTRLEYSHGPVGWNVYRTIATVDSLVTTGLYFFFAPGKDRGLTLSSNKKIRLHYRKLTSQQKKYETHKNNG